MGKLFNNKNYYFKLAHDEDSSGLKEFCILYNIHFSSEEVITKRSDNDTWKINDEGIERVDETTYLKEYRDNPHHFFRSIKKLNELVSLAYLEDDCEILDYMLEDDYRDRFFSSLDSMNLNQLVKTNLLISHLRIKSKEVYRKYSYLVIKQIINPIKVELKNGNELKGQLHTYLSRIINTLKAMERTFNSLYIFDEYKTDRNDFVYDDSFKIKAIIKKNYMMMVDNNKNSGYYLLFNQLYSTLLNNYRMIDYAFNPSKDSSFYGMPLDLIGKREEGGWNYYSILENLANRLEKFFLDNIDDNNKRYLLGNKEDE